ncbi:hypothetical protein BGZ54_005185, partial [Gamsiella multidivaricata]
MEKNMAVPLRLGNYDTVWGDREEKRCRECGKLGHIQRECSIFQEHQRTKAHIRAVKEYQKGGPMRVTTQKSFAQITKGSGADNVQGNEHQGQQQQQQQPQQQPAQQQQQQGGNSTVNNTSTIKQNNALEKKVTQLQETIVRMQQEQQQVAQTNQLLMSIMIQMFSQQMGITIPKEQLLAAGLSADVSRNAMKSKRDPSTKTQDIPPANETLASLMTLLSTPKLARLNTQLPTNP